MAKSHRLLPRRKHGTSPQGRGARARQAMGVQQQKGFTLPGLTVPNNFLLNASDDTLASYELSRLAEHADLRAELHILLDRLIDTSAQAAIARWFRTNDRQTLKNAIENEESPIEYAKRMVAEGQRSDDELIPRATLEPGAAHLAAALRYQERNLAEGKCRYCPKPLDRNSVDMCTQHLDLARHRAARKSGVKGEPGGADFLYGEITESTHGRQPGTLQSLAMSREKKTRAVLAELGLPAGSTATALEGAKAALLVATPRSKKDAMMAWELFEKAGISDSLESTAKHALV